MTDRRMFSREEGNLLRAYFDVADEIYESLRARKPQGVPSTGLEPLTLADLDGRSVSDARKAATTFGLAWPPYLPDAEEFFLDHHHQIPNP